jgi:Glycosyl hydrolase 2 galactose-binding domain-like
VAEVRVLRLERGRAYVVTNERAAAVEVTATFPTTGVPEIWDPETGTATPAGVWQSGVSETAVYLRLEPKVTQLVVFRTAREPVHAVSSTAPVQQVRIQGRNAIATVRVHQPGTVTVAATDGRRRYQGSAEVTDPLAAIPLDGDWLFRLDRAGAPETTRPLGSWTAVDSTYSGSAWYERGIVLDVATLTGRRWMLDLGDVHDVAEITVNGSAAGSRLWMPYRADVTSALRPGGNVIRVRVTNTGANARGQVLTSGLIGPVFLRPDRLADVTLPPTRA